MVGCGIFFTPSFVCVRCKGSGVSPSAATGYTETCRDCQGSGGFDRLGRLPPRHRNDGAKESGRG